MSDTASSKLRERGNQYFGRAAAASASHERLSLYEVARSLYEESLGMACSPDEHAYASVHKNLGATLLQLASFQGNIEAQQDMLLQSVQHKCQAYVIGPEANKSDAWLDTAWGAIDTSITELLTLLTSNLGSKPAALGAALHTLDLLHAAIPEEVCEWRMYASRDMLTGVRDVAAALIDPTGAAAAARGAGGRAGRATGNRDADWKACLRLVAEANRPLIEALQMALDFDDTDEASGLLSLEDELYVMECRAASTQARLQGEELLQHTLRQRQDRLDRKQQQQVAAAATAAAAAATAADSDASDAAGRDQSQDKTQRQQQQQQQQGPADPNPWHTFESRKIRRAKRQAKGRHSQQQQQQEQGSGAPTAPKPQAPAPAPAAPAMDEDADAAAECCEREGLLAALDLFKSAALLARERDLQAEAHALSRLGHLYKVCAPILDPILVPNISSTADGDGGGGGSTAAAPGEPTVLLSRSADERSRDAFLRVVLLVDALPHKISLMMEDWYREARDAISAYQASRAAAEEERKEAERAPVREALKSELQALYDAANRGWVDLIKHCYEKHPPLNPANRLAADAVFDAEHGKDLLRKAILAYHPDKQGAAGVPFSWVVLAEEITKQLTRKYECFK